MNKSQMLYSINPFDANLPKTTSASMIQTSNLNYYYYYYNAINKYIQKLMPSCRYPHIDIYILKYIGLYTNERMYV